MTGEIDRTIVQPAVEKSRDRVAHRLLLLGALVALAGVAWLAIVYFSQHSQISELQQTSDSRAVDVGKLAQQVKSLGATPVVQAPAPGPAPVDPAALRAAARSAVDDYCSTRNQCRGADGATPNFDDIVTAVVNLIPKPANGTNGTNGTNGDRGPGPTDEQVSSAVADYCDAHNQCAGAPGATGQTGAPGPTCPDGYVLGDAVITQPDGTTRPGKACIDPNSSTPPSDTPNPNSGG